jgi:hypothetical protein
MPPTAPRRFVLAKLTLVVATTDTHNLTDAHYEPLVTRIDDALALVSETLVTHLKQQFPDLDIHAE